VVQSPPGPETYRPDFKVGGEKTHPLKLIFGNNAKVSLGEFNPLAGWNRNQM